MLRWYVLLVKIIIEKVDVLDKQAAMNSLNHACRHEMEDRLRLQKKSYLIIAGVVAAILLLAGSQVILGGKKSDENTKKAMEVKQFVLEGWRIKNDARLYENREKLLDFKQRLMDYYSAESGALIEQQRLIDALTAADVAASTDDNSGEQILSFNLSDVTFSKEKVTDKEAELTAELEFFMKYHTKTQTYSTSGKNTYNWQLKKEKDKWKIVKEELVSSKQ